VDPRDRYWRTIAALALLLCALLLGDRYVRAYFLSATAPRETAPRTDFAGEEARTTALFAKTAPSVVAVYVRKAGGLSSSGGLGTGSGFVWDKAGHIVTNNHVIEEATEIGVALGGEQPLPAQLVGTAPWADLAVLRLTDPPDDLQPIPIGTSSDLAVGQYVYAIGNPFGLSRSLTTGIISALDRRLPTAPGREAAGVIQTDAAVNPGNSGGALVDSSGKVIGVPSSIASLGSSFEGQSGSIGLGFSIPINEAKSIADQLIANGKAEHPLLGVTLKDGSVKDGNATRSAAIIAEVSNGTPAATAGLRSDDAIIKVDGELVNGSESLVAQIRERNVGSRVSLTIMRDGKQQTVQVTLASRSSD